MKYECADCRTPLYINPAAAWPERCPVCHAAPLRVNTRPDPAISVTHAIGVSFQDDAPARKASDV